MNGKRPLLLVVFSAASALMLHAAEPGGAWRFEFTGPLPRWQDGLPVGNSRIGAQSWGTGPELFLTLDRSDVWDLRYQPNQDPKADYARLRELVRTRRADLIQKETPADVSPTADSTPFHLAAGRLRIRLPEKTNVERVELDMRQAEVRWALRVGGNPVIFRVFACATENVMVATLDGPLGARPHVSFEALAEIQWERLKALGYEKPQREGEENTFSVIQPIPESGQVVTMWRIETRPRQWQLLLTITAQDDPDPVSAARRTLQAAARLGLAELRARHQAWWQKRWARASVDLPDETLQRLWINGLYKLASSSHHSVPANLQGLWPPDGEIPPWRGDYHTDMNVQQTYWPAYSSNQLDLSEPLNRWLVERAAPQSEAFTKRFFGVDGIMLGGAYDVRGRLLGGPSNWMTVQYWLGGGGWMAQHLWWYYRYSLDRDFLRRDAYPFMKKCLQFYENILEKGEDSRRHLPLSTSPEYFSNNLAAWTPDPTCDLAIIRNLVRYTIAAAEALGLDEAERTRWRVLLADVAPYPVSARTGLKVQPNEEYTQSHRHPMHLFAIFPGEELTVEGTPADLDLINKSIQFWILRGMGEWTGWSYPYGSLIASRVRRANHALNLLKIYEQAFIWPNGFHVNGDYKKLGFSYYTYEPFTMEAECGFTAAVNEMLLQGWGGKLRVFPAVPEAWPDVSFENLRAEGALLVSAERRAGRVTRLSILSEKGGEVRLVWPLGPLPAGEKFEEQVLRFQPGERKDIPVSESGHARS